MSLVLTSCISYKAKLILQMSNRFFLFKLLFLNLQKHYAQSIRAIDI